MFAALQHDSTQTGKFQFFVRKELPTPGMSDAGIEVISGALESSRRMGTMMRQTEQARGQLRLLLIVFGRKRLGDRMLILFLIANGQAGTPADPTIDLQERRAPACRTQKNHQ
jgi:hypothetical protein